jgi:hypothetical protein
MKQIKAVMLEAKKYNVTYEQMAFYIALACKISDIILLDKIKHK